MSVHQQDRFAALVVRKVVNCTTENVCSFECWNVQCLVNTDPININTPLYGRNFQGPICPHRILPRLCRKWQFSLWTVCSWRNWRKERISVPLLRTLAWGTSFRKTKWWEQKNVAFFDKRAGSKSVHKQLQSFLGLMNRVYCGHAPLPLHVVLILIG